MPLVDRMARWGGARLSRRFARTMPLIGAGLALATLAATMRRKGLLRGALDTGLNAMPFVGAAKNTFEIVRGRDLIPDRVASGPDLTRGRGGISRRGAGAQGFDAEARGAGNARTSR